jgi:hypothetical protein
MAALPAPNPRAAIGRQAVLHQRREIVLDGRANTRLGPGGEDSVSLLGHGRCLARPYVVE